MPTRDPCLIEAHFRPEDLPSLGDPLVDRYLVFLAARARRNTVLAAISDLRAFFKVMPKAPAEVTTADVLGFITEQRRARPSRQNVVRISDGEAGLSSRTIQRRLASLSGLFNYMVLLDERPASPVPRGLSTRRVRGRGRLIPLVRSPRTLPKILEPAEVDALVAALRHYRDRAMVEAMVLGGLRRCEVLGLRFEDLRPGEGRVFIAMGKGGHQRLIPIAARFYRTLGNYLDQERPEDSETERVFVVLKGSRRGRPLSEDGLDEIVRSARQRAGLLHASCHQRHTCLTRLREAGMALKAIQAQAGHRSIESTRIYLHLANDWLADEYLRASELIDAGRAEILELAR